MDSEKENQSLSRREALKTLIAVTGAAAISTLPDKWETPNVEIGYLPAHAQASPTPVPTPVLGTGDLQATLRWNTGNPEASNCFAGGDAEGAVDIDLHVVEPDGTRVFFGDPEGPTAELDVDNQVAFGPENIFVPAGQAASGNYHVQVVYFCGNPATTATITIRVFANTAQEQTATFTRSLQSADSGTAINVAQVTFPAGDIQEDSGTGPVSDAVRNAEKR